MITIFDGESPQDIARAAGLLRDGELVAFPTETVYGLGADALNPDAVAKIFVAKGRPATNPLISHVSSIDAARQLVGGWPAQAQALADEFWPGPLTFVLERGPSVPSAVTAGLDTMGVRMPDHPVALALIEAAGRPLAAPSANRYTRVSATTAQHVVDGLGDRVSYVVDGGATRVGIESTVLSLVGEVPQILRPGAVTAAAIASIVGRVEVVGGQHLDDHDSRPSPGLSRKHYAPSVPLFVVEDLGDAAPFGERDFVIARSPVDAPSLVAHSMGAHRMVVLGDDPVTWARELYALLHRQTPERTDRIVVERPPESPEWLAILDRLLRAAS